MMIIQEGRLDGKKTLFQKPADGKGLVMYAPLPEAYELLRTEKGIAGIADQTQRRLLMLDQMDWKPLPEDARFEIFRETLVRPG